MSRGSEQKIVRRDRNSWIWILLDKYLNKLFVVFGIFDIINSQRRVWAIRRASTTKKLSDDKSMRHWDHEFIKYDFN